MHFCRVIAQKNPVVTKHVSLSQPSKGDCSRYSWGNSSKPKIIWLFCLFSAIPWHCCKYCCETHAGERKPDSWLHPRELKHPYTTVPMQREDSCAPRRCLAPLWTQSISRRCRAGRGQLYSSTLHSTPSLHLTLYRILVSGELFGIIIWNSLVTDWILERVMLLKFFSFPFCFLPVQ